MMAYVEGNKGHRLAQLFMYVYHRNTIPHPYSTSFFHMASPADTWSSPAHLHTGDPQNTSHREHPSVQLYPHGAFSLSAISLRAACLGFVCAFALNLTWAFRDSYPQLPFFVALLSFFHFIEYWITAEYNTRRAKVEGLLPPFKKK